MYEVWPGLHYLFKCVCQNIQGKYETYMFSESDRNKKKIYGDSSHLQLVV